VPAAELRPWASRHLPEAVLTNSPLRAVHFCAPVPLQPYSWILALLVFAPPVTSRHLPSALTSSPLIVHCWAPVPLQLQSCTAVPSAEAAPATSTHLPPIPVIGPPAAARALVTPRTPRVATTALETRMARVRRRGLRDDMPANLGRLARVEAAAART